MIWLLAALAFTLPWTWRYVAVTGSVVAGVFLILGGAMLVVCVLFVFGGMLFTF